MSRTWDRKRIAPAIANASQSDRKTSPAPETEAEAATEAAAERSSTTRDETSHHGVGLGDASARDEMMTATRQQSDPPPCRGYAWTTGCGLPATLTAATLIPCAIPTMPLMDLCDRCWSAMGQTRHGCCERHYPDGSKTRDQSFVVIPGQAPPS